MPMSAATIPRAVALPRPAARARTAAAHVAVALAVVAVLLPGLRDVPIAVDEPVYHFVARQNVEAWYRALATTPAFAVSDAGIRQYWGYNHEHPGFPRLLAATPDFFLRGWPDPLVALRFGSALLAVLLVFEVFHFTRRCAGATAGAFAAAAVLLIPCLYGHACIAAMDFPVAVLGFLATAAFARGIERPRWAVLFGIWLGLALSSKINAAFTAIPLVLWALAYHRRASAPNLFALLLVAPLAWLATWPWLWHDTANRLLEYFQFHKGHAVLNAAYFGQVYSGTPPPWHYPFYFLLVSVPLAILVPSVIGVAGAFAGVLHQRARSEHVLLVAAMLTPVLVLALPGVPKYDGARLILGAFPFVACLAGIGFSQALAPLARRPAVAPLAAVLLLAPAAVVLYRLHPFEGYSYYNWLAGGTRGAFERGFSAAAWGLVDRSTVAYLNQHGKPGDALYPGTGASLPLRGYAALGLLRQDFKFEDRADWIVVEYNRAYANWADWWPFYRDEHPWYDRVHQVEADGTPVLGLFRARREPRRDANGKVATALVRPPDAAQR